MTGVVQKSYTVLYWDCGNEKHHHKTREVAERCMAKRLKAEAWKAEAPNGRNGKMYPPERPLLVLRDYLREGTLQKAADINGVSRERVRQFVWKAWRMIQKSSLQPLKQKADRHPVGSVERNEALDAYAAATEDFRQLYAESKSRQREVEEHIDRVLREMTG